MPRDRRRRARRRSAGPLLLLSAATLLIAALAIGGALAIHGASAPYRRDVNRSFADQGSVVADQSAVVGRQLRQLMAELPTLRRSRLQERLDALVTDTAAQDASARGLVPPYPPAGVGPEVISVFDSRAAAVVTLRRTLDGLLGLEPLPDVGSATQGGGTTGATSATGATTGAQGSGGGNPTLLSASRATADLESVGQQLEQADHTYATARRVLATSAGNGQLPRSVWVTHPGAWSAGALSTLVSELTVSGSLATSHELELVTVSIVPAAIPPPSGPAPPGGVTTVPPTSTLGVSVVLRDIGNVAEHGVVVSASVQQLHSDVVHTRHATVSLDPATSMAVSFAALPVKPGRSYTLAISLSSPSAPGSPGPATSYTVAVAPATPPPTTTTTTRPASASTTTTTSAGHTT